MTTIAVLGDRYNGTYTDFLEAKDSTAGEVRIQSGSTTIPSGTAADAYVMGFPFAKGTTFLPSNACFHIDQLAGSVVQLDIGVVYADDTTDQPTLFRSLSGIPQTVNGGTIVLTGKEWMAYEAPADGWVVARIKTGATTQQGDFTFQIGIARA